MSRVLITFSVLEKPIPKPGLIPNGHGGVRYPRPQADHYRAFKSAIRAAAEHRLPEDWVPTTEPCVVKIILEFPRTKSRLGKEGIFWHTEKPDLENAGSKPILDALTGLVWVDDDQVVVANQVKLWSPDIGPRVTVQVVALGPNDDTRDFVIDAIGFERT